MTDVVFGNLHRMLTVHTKPLTLRGDNRPAVVFRFLERKVLLYYCINQQRRRRFPLLHIMRIPLPSSSWYSVWYAGSIAY